jgi:hypothetical protein
MTVQQPGWEKTQELKKVLQTQDSTSLPGSMGRLVKGIVWCFLVGLVLTTIIYGICDSLFVKPLLGWWAWFFVYLLILAGLLFWQERRTRDVPVVSTAPPPEGGEIASSPAPPNKVVSIVYWGPPAIIDGLRGVRGRRTRAQEKLFDRAAILVFDLARRDGSVDLKYLIHPPEDMKTFGEAVDWLDTHDWIGKATSGGGMWLSTLGRKRLVERGLNPVQTGKP